MPESKGRRIIRSRVPVDPAREALPATSPRWLAPLMVAMFLIGLLWIVAYYLVPDLAFFGALGSWNIVVGFGFIMVGFALSTRWR